MGSENLTSVTEFILEGLTSHRKTQILLFAVILLIYTFTVLANLSIIGLVWTDPHLKTPMYFFLSNLSTLEICYVTFSMPEMLARLHTGNGIISFNRCVAQVFVCMCLGTLEFFLLGVMAYDRYMAICHPLVYVTVMGKGRQLQLALVAWLCSFFVALLYLGCLLRHPYCGPNHINHFYCELPLVLKLACADTHITEAMVFMIVSMVLAGPLVIIVTSYTLIISTVLKIKSTAAMYKAISTCGSHLLVVTLFYTTIASMYMRPRSISAPDLDKQISVFYIVIIPLLNPIIYTLRNKDIHVAVARVLRRWRGTQEKNIK